MLDAIITLLLHLFLFLVCCFIGKSAVIQIMENLHTTYTYETTKGIVYLIYAILLSMICLMRISVVLQYIEVI